MFQSVNKRIHIATSGCCNNNCLFCCDRDLPNGGFGCPVTYHNLYSSDCLTIEAFKKKSKRTDGVNSILFTGGKPTLNSVYAEKIGWPDCRPISS